MRVLPRLALHLFDPRGRSDRTEFLHAAIAIFLLQATLFLVLWKLSAELDHVSTLPANALFLWMGTAAVSRRLHDLGRSAWWMPISLLIWLAGGFVLATLLAAVIGPQRLFPGAPAFWVVFFCLLAPPFVVALWLHVCEGEAGPNRFGPASAREEAGQPHAEAALHDPDGGTALPRRIAAHA